MTEKFLKIDQVCEQTTLSESEVKRRVKQGEFPQPVQIGKARKAWVASEVDAWVKQTIEQARSE